MQWSSAETERFGPILRQLRRDLGEAQSVAVLGSAGGDIPLWLAGQSQAESIIGLELDEGLLRDARARALEQGVAGRIGLLKMERDRIPLSANAVDVVVSDLALFPSPVPARIGLREMGRVLRPGGRLILLDVLLSRPMPEYLRGQLRNVGLDYLNDARLRDYDTWMAQAALTDVQILDFTFVLREVWEARCVRDRLAWHAPGYDLLLDDPNFSLGRGIFYIYARGARPE